jgi:hypothetical protein
MENKVFKRGGIARTSAVLLTGAAMVAGSALPAWAGVNDNTIAIADASVVEGDTGTTSITFTVTRSTPIGVTTVEYATADATASAGSDYGTATGTVTFAEGDTSETITVVVNGDSLSELDEVLLVNLSAPSNGTITDNQARGEVNNDDAPQLVYAAGAGSSTTTNLILIDAGTGAVVREIGPIGFAVTGLAVDPLTGVMYGSTSNNSAQNPGSLIRIDTETGAGTLVGSYGLEDETAADITFTADGTLYGWIEPGADDLFVIDKATGVATLVGNSGLSTSGAGLAADGSDTIYFAGSSSSGPLRTINRTTGAPTTVVTMQGPGQAISALAFACDGETLLGSLNTGGRDGTSPNQLITVNEDTGAVVVIGPSTPQMDALEVRCPGGFEVSSATVAEDAGTATLTVTRVGGSDGAVGVSYSTSDGTATAGADYTSASGTLTFAHGETTKTITVPVVKDTVNEDDENVVVTLSQATGGAAVLTSTGVVTINDLQSFDTGYRLVASDGGVFTFGDRNFHGSTGDRPLNKPVVGGATDISDYDGYWLVASDGGVFTFNAEFHGSLAGQTLSAPAVEIEPTPTGKGYWIVLADGKVYTFGDANHFGDMSGKALNKPVIGMSVTPSGKGYWLVAGDGGIFNFGDAGFFGSMGDKVLNAPVIDLAPSVDNLGYYLLGSDGGVFTFGSADFKGSTGDMKLNSPVVAILVSPTGAGYWLGAADGGVFTFGAIPFLGSMGGTKLNGPVLDFIN